ncbi:MAG: thermonuclease family protein [Sandaracinaceae bacterium]
MTFLWRRAGAVGLAALLTTLLAGCPRTVGPTDTGPEPGEDGGTSNYDPVMGMPFTGTPEFDDERVRNLDPSLLRAGDTPCRAPILGRVVQAVDGDTILVDGESEVFNARVRMIGVDTPELAHDGMGAECYAREAQEFTENLVDHLVYLTFDNECFDRFDRPLAYIHVGGGQGDIWERQLLRRGFGESFPFGDNRTYEALFAGDQQTAVRDGVGKWGICF